MQSEEDYTNSDKLKNVEEANHRKEMKKDVNTMTFLAILMKLSFQ